MGKDRREWLDDPFEGSPPIGPTRRRLAGLILLAVPFYVVQKWPVPLQPPQPPQPPAAAPAAALPSPSLFLTTSGESRSEARLSEHRTHPSPDASVRVPVSWAARAVGDATPLTFAFDRGVGFHVTANACGGAESRTDGIGCSIEVRFAPESNGTYRDRLVVRKGEAFASLQLTGVGNGWSEGWLDWDAEWARTASAKGFVAGPGSGEGGTRELVARNTGSGPVAPATDDLFDPPRAGKVNPWKVLGGTCLTEFVKPGSTCTIRLSFAPTHDGPFSRTLRFSRMAGSRRPSMKVVGYARGIAGVLPPGVLGVGDKCPLPGESAEIAAPDPYDTRDLEGDFADKRGGVFSVTAYRCDAWSDAGQGGVRCPGGQNPGDATPGSTTEYRSASMSGPWDVYSRTRSYGGAKTVTCEDGRITIEKKR